MEDSLSRSSGSVRVVTSRGSGAQASSPQVRGSALQQPRRLAMQQLPPHLQLQAWPLHPSTDASLTSIRRIDGAVHACHRSECNDMHCTCF